MFKDHVLRVRRELPGDINMRHLRAFYDSIAELERLYAAGEIDLAALLDACNGSADAVQYWERLYVCRDGNELEQCLDWYTTDPEWSHRERREREARARLFMAFRASNGDRVGKAGYGILVMSYGILPVAYATVVAEASDLDLLRANALAQAWDKASLGEMQEHLARGIEEAKHGAAV